MIVVMDLTGIVLVKYIFLDVVAYTKRTVEVQCYITNTLNRLVKGAVTRYQKSCDCVIYLPTGDGICIALPNAPQYDIHVTIAKEILRRISVNNSRVKDDNKKFEVRVGINQGDDNIVIDINGKQNVAGAGINNTRRIMDLANARQILVSSIVYENLYPRQIYHKAFSPQFQYMAKHGLPIKIHQLIQPDVDWLSVDIPATFKVEAKTEPKLTELAAHYFAHSIKNNSFLLGKRGLGQNNFAMIVLLWYLSIDSLRKSRPKTIGPHLVHMPETKSNTLDEQFQVLMGLPFMICVDLSQYARDYKIGRQYYNYFEDGWEFTIINKLGQSKLKSEWPDIWNDFGLG